MTQAQVAVFFYGSHMNRTVLAVVYGVLAAATHAELERLYSHARDVLGEIYRPEAVLVQTRDGSWKPALCYIASEMVDQTTDPVYVERILKPARELGFPSWYLSRLESFRSVP